MITGTTRLVGLLGSPVAGSLSPRMQNAAFAARGCDWAYVPLEVAPERLAAAMGGLVAFGFVGANVTIPHKSTVLGLCDELDDVARRAGSVNTLVIDGGRVLGSSTDGEAVAGAVATRGARVLLLGAGGSARAVGAALAAAGAASIAVAARDPARARELAGALGQGARPASGWPPAGEEDATLVVNATPIRDTLVYRPLPGQEVVELAYNADGEPTALEAAATAVGCRVVDGREVLVRQGAASFQRWTGMEPPLETMREAVRLEPPPDVRSRT